MQAFHYQHGDRPLEGYTIQRAVGRGGFGEVYYALSDSGREVALKVIQGYEQIELRGVSQCMNLKSPYLVTIFDVRHNEKGLPFVIMEYVAGPCLRELIDEAPGGLGTQKTAFFLREIAKGLSYLHERGIVHRDLKPGNIFYEDGYVKIGDYGLSKAMTASQHSGQTITVGTVHYMAPEIGQGRYDASIDLYAMGCVLYEMLTGQTPFLGASPGEILMKHMASEPDLAGIPEPFASVIRKALAKNPADRFATAQEMVEAVFGTEQIRNSVSAFQPASLSMAAERVGHKIVVGGPGSSAEHTGATIGKAGDPTADAGGWEHFGRRMDEVGRRVTQAGERIGQRMTELGSRLSRQTAGETAKRGPQLAPLAAEPAGSNDPLNWNQRRVLGILTAGAVGIGSTAANQGHGTTALPMAVALFLIIGAAAGGLVAVRLKYLAKLRYEGAIVQRLAFVLAASVLTLAFLMPALVASEGARGRPNWVFLPSFLIAVVFAAAMRLRRERMGRTTDRGRLIYMLPLVLACGGLAAMASGRTDHFQLDELLPLLAGAPALLFLNWRKLSSPFRPDRFSLGAAIWGAFLAYIAAGLLAGSQTLAAGAMAGIVLVTQIVCPWDPIAAQEQKKRRQAGRPLMDDDDSSVLNVPAPTETSRDRQGAVSDAGEVPLPDGRGSYASPPARAMGRDPSLETPATGSRARQQLLPIWVRTILLLVFLGTGALCPTLLTFAAVSRFQIHDQGEQGLFVGLGLGAGLFAMFCLWRMIRPAYRNLWTGLFKPLLILACVECGMGTLGYLSTSYRIGSDEVIICVFLAALSALIAIAAFCIPGRVVDEVSASAAAAFTPPTLRARSIASPKLRLYALLLSLLNFIPFCPLAGIHRFYVGKIGTGILYLFTGGIIGIGTIIDVIRIAMGTFTDSVGRPLLAWNQLDELTDAPAPPTTALTSTEAQPRHTTPLADTVTPMRVHLQPLRATANSTVIELRPASPRHAFSRILANFAFGLGGAFTLLSALKTPELIAAGWPDPSLTHELEEAFDHYETWPQLLQTIGRIAAGGFLLAGGVLLMLARRGSTVGHFSRAALGMIALLIAASWSFDYCAFMQWNAVADKWRNGQVGPGLGALFDQFETQSGGHLIGILSFLIGGIILLAWPQQRREEAAA